MPAASRRPFAERPPLPTGKDTALAGGDGRELARLIRAAQSRGAAALRDVVRGAVARRLESPSANLLDTGEMGRLAAALAAVVASADLLGRCRVRERADAPDARPFASVSRFADEVVIATPEAALDYFLGLVPALHLDPDRFGDAVRRRAFTLAESTDAVLTARVQAAIADGLREHRGTADAANAVDDILDAAGVGPRNPQYSEMVFRTNAQDAYQQAAYEEARSPDLRGTFPVWRYLGIRDGRQGRDHEPKFDKLYPAEAPFAAVRGPRPFNCRCALEWVTADEWAELQAGGARVETTW